jgi:hypothetical protein
VIQRGLHEPFKHEVLQPMQTVGETTMPVMSVQEALEDFRSKHPDANQQIAGFIGAPLNTVRLWKRDRMPNAGNMLKLQVFLAEQGFQLNTPTHESSTVRYLAELVAFRVLSDEDAYTLLFSNNEERNQLWAVFRGDRTPRPIRENTLTLEDLTETYSSELASQRAKLLPRTGRVQVSSPPRAPKSQAPGQDESKQAERADLLVVQTSSALLACLPHLKALDISNNPEVGSQVRELMGSDNFFDLLDTLKGMSSREAGRFFNPQSTRRK